MKNEKVDSELKTVTFSLESCFQTFEQSFNRVKFFTAIAENSTEKAFPMDWGVKNAVGLNYVVNGPETDRERENILKGYRHFINCYVVRDCIESFALSLDSIYLALLINGKKVASNKTLLDVLSDDEKSRLNKFEWASIASPKDSKVKYLRKHFGLDLPKNQKEVLASLKDIRHCFAHGNGIVRPTDGKSHKNNERLFSWTTMKLIARGNETGTEYPINISEETMWSISRKWYDLYSICSKRENV